MSYTASALSFMFQDLGKSVILTGSQVPLSEWRTDAEENLLGALFLAGHFVIPEVGVFFGNKLFRGNRVTKVDALDFLAFDSPNLKPLATMGVNVDVNWTHVRRPNTTSRFKVYKSLSKKVASLKLYPGISLNALSATLDSGIQGLVLETFGAGNSPSNRKDLLERIAKACDDGIIIINCTQCRRGMVSDLYETGKALSKIGVVSGSDMTPECAFTKLCYVLVLDISYEAKRNMCSKNLRGELTVLPSNLNDKAKFRSQFIEAVVDSMGFSSPIERNIVERALLPQIISSALLTKDHTFFEHLCNYSENISSLVNIGDFQGRSALYYAACNGSVSTAKKLLDLGANVHQRTFLGETVLGCGIF
jgi:lysophospholipase